MSHILLIVFAFFAAGFYLFFLRQRYAHLTSRLKEVVIPVAVNVSRPRGPLSR